MCTRSESTGSRCARAYRSEQHRFGALDRRGQTDDLKAVAAAPHFDAEPGFDLVQMLIEGPAQFDQSDVVRRREQHVARHRN